MTARILIPFFLLLLPFRSPAPVIFQPGEGWHYERPGPKIAPLSHAHAHNDYEHARPLFDALDHGFCSVEADIYLVNGKLLVAHDRSKTSPERTLESLYLEPLHRIARKNHGKIFRDAPEFFLLIDIKSDPEETYRALRTSLKEYADQLTTFDGGRKTKRAVTIVLTGNRPVKMMAAEEICYAGIDGRLEDLSAEPNPLMVWMSDNWQKHFQWRGKGPIGAAEKKKLDEIVSKAHARKLKVRFWAAPDQPGAWSELRSADIDLINTDDLAGLQKFFIPAKHQGAAGRSSDGRR